MVQKVDGVCALTGEYAQIHVIYAEIRAIGGHGFRKVRLECECAEESSVCCNCPIFTSAPNAII